MIQVTFDQNVFEVQENTSVLSFISQREDIQHIYAVVVDGKLHDINYILTKNCTLSFVYDTSETGKLIYERTLVFLFIVAVHALDESASVSVEHSLSQGQYCEIIKDDFLTPSDVHEIKNIMKDMVNKHLPIIRDVKKTSDAVALFKEKKMYNKASLLAHRKSKTSSVYTLDGYMDYFYGIMLPNTSYIDHFSIQYYAPGVWLSPYPAFENQQKLFHVFQEFEHWGKRIHVSNVAQLNEEILRGNMDTLVLMSETMIEKKLAELATNMLHEQPNTKFILIAGPSSAGKTTFSRRLSIHLKILGKQPVAISMDNFYHNRVDCPKLEDGSYDFECLEALDIELFNDTMLKLLHKIPVRLPIFNFKTGVREWQSHETILQEDDILIIEGIHGLNPKTSMYLPDDAKYKIYINALTHLNLDEHNRIPTSDYRLIRRIARDYQFRSWDAQATIHSWKNVRDGEDKYIYPYQEQANVIFNSSMIYELSILKGIVVPLLQNVKKEEPAYLEANRLHKFLEYFIEADASAVPRSSILAEFIGNSVFDVN